MLLNLEGLPLSINSVVFYFYTLLQVTHNCPVNFVRLLQVVQTRTRNHVAMFSCCHCNGKKAETKRSAQARTAPSRDRLMPLVKYRKSCSYVVPFMDVYDVKGVEEVLRRS